MAKTNNTVQASWVALGSFSSFALSIISAAVLSRYFDKTDYGTYKQILYVYGTLLFVFTAGLPRVFAYFLPRYSLEEGKSIVWKVSKVLFFSGLIFSIILYIFSSSIASILNNEDLDLGLKVFSPIPMLLLPTLGIEGIFSTYKKTVYIAIYNTISRLLMLLFIVGPVIIFNGTLIHAIYGWIIVSFLTLIMAYYFKGIPFKGVKSSETGLKFKEIFSYSLPLVMASLWSIAMRSADQFYISRFFGTEVFAEFSNGFIELPFVTMVTSSTTVVLMPIFSKVFYEGVGIEQLLSTWRNALKKSAIIIYPLVVYFIVFSSEAMVALYSEAYADSAIYFRINMMLNFFNIIVFGPLFFASGRTKLFAKVHMYLAALIWTSGYVMVLLFNSPTAIAINSTAINIGKILFFIYLSSRFMKVRYFDFFPIKSLASLIIHSVLMVSITKLLEMYLIPAESIVLKLIFTFSIYGILLLVSGRLFGINYLALLQPFIKKIKS